MANCYTVQCANKSSVQKKRGTETEQIKCFEKAGIKKREREAFDGAADVAAIAN